MVTVQFLQFQFLLNLFAGFFDQSLNLFTCFLLGQVLIFVDGTDFSVKFFGLDRNGAQKLLTFGVYPLTACFVGLFSVLKGILVETVSSLLINIISSPESALIVRTPTGEFVFGFRPLVCLSGGSRKLGSFVLHPNPGRIHDEHVRLERSKYMQGHRRSTEEYFEEKPF